MIHKPKLGPTGDFPRGKNDPHDEGGLRIGVALDSHGDVVINFGTPVHWIAMPREELVGFCNLLLKRAGASKVEITF